MSAFMSFVGGGLRAVNDSINRHREYLSEQDERDFKREEWQFKRDTEKQVAKIRAEATSENAHQTRKLREDAKFETIAGNIKYSKSGTESERVSAAWAALIQNEEEIKRLLGDANGKNLIKNQVNKYIHRWRNDKANQKATFLPNGHRTNIQKAIPSLKIQGLHTNQTLLNMVKELEQNKGEERPVDYGVDPTKEFLGWDYTEAFPTANALSRGIPLNTVKNALDQHLKSKLKIWGQFPDKNKIYNSIKGQFGKYNSEASPWEGSNKFWHAWNSPFVKIISGEINNTLKNRKEARDWLRSRASGFSDDDGILDRESVLRLVRVYGKKNASVPGGDPGFPEAPWFWGAYLSKNSVAKKEMLAKQASGRMAERAGKTLNGMIEASLNIGTGSDLLSDTILVTEGVKETIKSAVRIFGNILSPNSKNEDGQGFDVDNPLKRRLAALMKEYSGAKKKEDISAARLKTFKMMLAYQLTTILQGGTGGRTISDTDVTRTLTMFGGTFDSLDQKLAKLKVIKSFIDDAKLIGLLHNPDNLRSEDNKELYHTYQKVYQIINPEGGDAFSRFEKYVDSKIKRDIDWTNNSQLKKTSYSRVNEIENIISRERKIEIDKKEDERKFRGYNRLNVQDFLKNKINWGEAEDPNLRNNVSFYKGEGNNYYLINKTQWDKWYSDDALKKGSLSSPGKEAKKLKELREGIEQNGKYAFNLTTGKVVELQYSQTFTSQGAPSGFKITIKPTTLTKAFGGRILQPNIETNKRGILSSSDAVKKLFSTSLYPDSNR